MRRNEQVQLPEHFRKYFWDCCYDDLTWDQHRSGIITRLAQSGGMDAFWWLKQQVGDDAMREFIVGRNGRGIEPRRLRFWGLVVDIPRDQVDEWIAVWRRNPWSDRLVR